MAHINPDGRNGRPTQGNTLYANCSPCSACRAPGLQETTNGEYIVKMEGVDIYNPVDNTVSSAGADKVAAWFVDADYDGRTFCITQAFFPDKSAWDKIARALKGVIDEDSL